MKTWEEILVELHPQGKTPWGTEEWDRVANVCASPQWMEEWLSRWWDDWNAKDKARDPDDIELQDALNAEADAATAFQSAFTDEKAVAERDRLFSGGAKHLRRERLMSEVFDPAHQCIKHPEGGIPLLGKWLLKAIEGRDVPMLRSLLEAVEELGDGSFPESLDVGAFTEKQVIMSEFSNLMYGATELPTKSELRKACEVSDGNERKTHRDALKDLGIVLPEAR